MKRKQINWIIHASTGVHVLAKIDKDYNPFDAMRFTDNRCFLCGRDLEGNRTVEHIFPKWLQDRYELWNQKLSLINDSNIKYGQLSIPCCSVCNSQYLSRVENKIFDYVSNDKDFKQMPEVVIFQWMAKILYGLLYKQSFLLVDRRESENGTIVNREILERYKVLHLFLQSVRVPMRINGSLPWSIFITKNIEYGDRRDFDYHDEILGLAFSIRMGRVGLIAALLDNGIQKQMFDGYFFKFRNIDLHPMQFDELSAKVAYKSKLLKVTPKHIFVWPDSPEPESELVVVSNQSFGDVYEEWNQKEYAHVLALYWRKFGVNSYEEIFREPNRVLSHLEDEEGRQLVYDRNDNKSIADCGQ